MRRLLPVLMLIAAGRQGRADRLEICGTAEKIGRLAEMESDFQRARIAHARGPALSAAENLRLLLAGWEESGFTAPRIEVETVFAQALADAGRVEEAAPILARNRDGLARLRSEREAAHRHSSDRFSADLELARLLVIQGEFARAERLYRRLGPRAEVLYDHAILLWRSGRADEAEKMYVRAGRAERRL